MTIPINFLLNKFAAISVVELPVNGAKQRLIFEVDVSITLSNQTRPFHFNIINIEITKCFESANYLSSP